MLQFGRYNYHSLNSTSTQVESDKVSSWTANPHYPVKLVRHFQITQEADSFVLICLFVRNFKACDWSNRFSKLFFEWLTILRPRLHQVPVHCTVQNKQLITCKQGIQFCSAWPKNNIIISHFPAKIGLLGGVGRGGGQILL